jgi:hypothetical protein
MPSPSDRTGVVASPATEDTDCHFSKKNWSGLEESSPSGATANVAWARNLEQTIPGSKYTLSTVPKGAEEEKKEEDLVDTESVVAKMAKKQDGAGDDVSLASVNDKEAESSLTKAVKKTGPPCHQSMETHDMEVSSDKEDEEETKTASSHKMYHYQMKLSTHKKNAMGQLMKVVKTMFKEERSMEIELYD